MRKEENEVNDIEIESTGRVVRFDNNSSEDNKRGWAIFDEEMAWFLYDFFKKKLNGYEKLIFYSYYINGFTNEELANILGISTQATSVKVLSINAKLKKTWHNRKSWS